MFGCQVPPSCCKSPSLDCGVSRAPVFLLSFERIRSRCKIDKLNSNDIEFLDFCFDHQVRLHPSNIHYSGCAHSLAETISSHLKLVCFHLYNLGLAIYMYINLHCVLNIFLADLCCRGAFGGFTSDWIISLNQTQTNPTDALVAKNVFTGCALKLLCGEDGKIPTKKLKAISF